MVEKGLSFICVMELCFLANDSLTTKLSQTLLIKPWNYMFTPLLKQPCYCHFLFVHVYWRGFDIFALVVITSTKNGKCAISLLKFLRFMKLLKVTMVVWLKELFFWYELLYKMIAYVKNEGVNLNTLTTTLIRIMFCVPL